MAQDKKSAAAAPAAGQQADEAASRPPAASGAPRDGAAPASRGSAAAAGPGAGPSVSGPSLSGPFSSAPSPDGKSASAPLDPLAGPAGDEAKRDEDVDSSILSRVPGATVVNLGSSTATLNHTLPPPIPRPDSPPPAPSATLQVPRADEPTELSVLDGPQRRAARRRPAGPVRTKIAANDDAPSIGGLIYALEQKPSSKPFKYAAVATAIWAIICTGFASAILSAEFEQGASLGAVLSKPTTFLTAVAILAPIAILWFLALLAWRSEELRLRSSTMTEVAIRLAEPDRMAEQSVASLGQAVRRQVSFMNDAIARALGRAGELEALVHNEVSALERSYEENERKIRGLIQELSGERNALLDTSERVTDTLRTLGTDIPTLIDKLSSQQLKLAQIIQGAGENLTALEAAVGQSAFQLETTVDESTRKLETTLTTRTDHLQGMLDSYTSGLAIALGARTEQLQDAIAGYVSTLDTSLSNRTKNLQAVFEEYGRALDTSLTNRAQALDTQLVERTKALDEAFGARLRSFDDQIVRSTMAIDSAIADKARALTSALDAHARTFSDTIARQAVHLDESLIQGISSVRRTSENITRQSLKAIEGLAGQSEMLKNVSENLLAQVNSVTNRFENQGQVIMRAANSLENANFKLESTLAGRHADLSNTLDRLSGKADEFGRFIEGYSTSIEGSLTEAEARARATAEQLKAGAETTRRTALAELEKLRAEAGTESERALEDLRRRFSSISNVVSEQLSTLSSRIDQTSDDVRQRATRAAAEIAAEQQRLREQMERLPEATRENAESMRRALQDQLRAIEQLSSLASRSIQTRDVAPPLPTPGPTAPPSLAQTYAAESRSAEASRALSSLSSPSADPSQRAAPRAGDPRQAPYPPQAALPRPGQGDGREAWSFGDLLARASVEDEQAPPHSMPPQQGTAGLHNQIEIIARALDPATAAALWGRINAGQRGVMVRSIYTPEGRAAFDDLTLRYRSDPELKRTIDHYLSDFENLKREAELRDPTGRAASGHLMSDMGRVYLFLAHVSGRLT